MTASINIGTVSWRHPQWQDSFYPFGMEKQDWPGFYAQNFSHVEIEESLYGLPDRAALSQWLSSTPETFYFTLTAPRTITHYKKLKNCEVQTSQMLTRLEGMEHRIQNILFRLPAGWRCNLRRLEEFLTRLPSTFRYLFEFDEASWYDEPVYETLRQHNAGLCIRDNDGQTTPLVSTTDLVYVRLSGDNQANKPNYHPQTLRGWSVKARGWGRKSKQTILSFGGPHPSVALKNAQRVRRYCE